MDLKQKVILGIKEIGEPSSPSCIKNKICESNSIESICENEGSKVQNILYRNAKDKESEIIRLSYGNYFLNDLLLQEKKRIESKIKNEIERQGFVIKDDKTIKKPDMSCKDSLRKFHYSACSERYHKNLNFINDNEEELIEFFANGNEINVNNISPTVKKVERGTIEYNLFRYATFLWSVPVSNGFGRRTKFIIIDENNGKLIGLFALGDPVFNLSCRDDLIGWDSKQREEKLYNVMDIFILGSVPPYNILLGGKLTGMIATTNKVRNVIYKKYKGTKTIIQEKYKDPSLALLTTASALGKSSIYDRIRFDGDTLYKRIGQSKGWGHFHLNHGLFNDMLDFLSWFNPDMVSSYKFGQGPNWKIRTARKCLSYTDLPQNILKHGIKREIYAIPLAHNYKEYLNGSDESLNSIDIPFNDIVEFWKERWLYGRAKRKPEYKEVTQKDILKRINRWEGTHKGSNDMDV